MAQTLQQEPMDDTVGRKTPRRSLIRENEPETIRHHAIDVLTFLQDRKGYQGTSDTLPTAGAQTYAGLSTSEGGGEQFHRVRQVDDVETSNPPSDVLPVSAASDIVEELLECEPSQEGFERAIRRRVPSVDKSTSTTNQKSSNHAQGRCISLFFILTFVALVVLPVLVFIALVVTLESRYADGLYMAQDFSDVRRRTAGEV